MVKYSFREGVFGIADYMRAKTFAGFLPAVAGVDGKPLWAFYANVGQAMGGFGAYSKETPITPFDSANAAYRNIPVMAFRTFLRVDGKLRCPFSAPRSTQIMSVAKTWISVEESGDGYRVRAEYTTVPHKDYAALLRRVEITNVSAAKAEFEVADGLPVFFPAGLSNYAYKELVSLMAAYCEVENLAGNAPFVKFKTSTGDNSVVSKAVRGNGFAAVDDRGQRLLSVVDPAAVFSTDKTFITVSEGDVAFDRLAAYPQQTENKLPCAFSALKRTLASGESMSFCEIYGAFDDSATFERAVSDLSVAGFAEAMEENERLMSALLSPAEIHTGDEIFDEYIKQCFLDNNLRGGFPIEIGGKGGVPYYVFSRKHGDMERDYNAFEIPDKYYSTGCGNFRDVNQNRRNDLVFYPFVGDFNIKIFFSLIQADGQNPLSVKPPRFSLEGEATAFLEKIPEDRRARVGAILPSYLPGELYEAMGRDCDQGLFCDILRASTPQIEADFGEGYWVDHWTYNADLVENFMSVFPDRAEFVHDGGYRYFDSGVRVLPRSEKYCLVSQGKIRQYGALDFSAKKTGTNWLRYKDGTVVETTLASKMFNLILVKLSTLDSRQLGIEMECEKPGWNDAMNGLPGLFASGMSETVELLRLVRITRKLLFRAGAEIARKDKENAARKTEIPMLKEQDEFYRKIKKCLISHKNGGSAFEFWNAATTAREKFRAQITKPVSRGKAISSKEADAFLKRAEALLASSVARAREVGGGIIPAYLIYEPETYTPTGRVNALGYEVVEVSSFRLITLPPFLEAAARAMKLGRPDVSADDYRNIKESGIYDRTLKFYKTCADIDDAPFEIGRVHAFTKGWLERECNFLHMTYKYLLGLLRGGFYREFYEEIKTNLVCYMPTEVYGRSPVENSSFIVPTCNPDKSLHGRGFFARLTGANAEMLDMFVNMFMGERLFEYDGGTLILAIRPKLAASFFDGNDEVRFRLFGSNVTVHNPARADCYAQGVTFRYFCNGTEGVISGTLAERVREGERFDIRVEVVPPKKNKK